MSADTENLSYLILWRVSRRALIAGALLPWVALVVRFAMERHVLSIGELILIGSWIAPLVILASCVVLLIAVRIRIAVDDSDLSVCKGIITRRVPVVSIRRSYLGFGRVVWIETTTGAQPVEGPWPGTTAHAELKEDIDWIASTASDWSSATLNRTPSQMRRKAV